MKSHDPKHTENNPRQTPICFQTCIDLPIVQTVLRDLWCGTMDLLFFHPKPKHWYCDSILRRGAITDCAWSTDHGQRKSGGIWKVEVKTMWWEKGNLWELTGLRGLMWHQVRNYNTGTCCGNKSISNTNRRGSNKRAIQGTQAGI